MNELERIALERIAKEAVNDFLKDFADDVDNCGTSFVRHMFNKRYGSFDNIYLFGKECCRNTEMNRFFCEREGIEIEKIASIISTDPSEISSDDAELLNAYTEMYEDVTAIAEKYAIYVVANRNSNRKIVVLNDKEVYFDECVDLMDDEIREELNTKMAPCDEQEFLDAYVKAHADKFDGEVFTI